MEFPTSPPLLEHAAVLPLLVLATCSTHNKWLSSSTLPTFPTTTGTCSSKLQNTTSMSWVLTCARIRAWAHFDMETWFQFTSCALHLKLSHPPPSDHPPSPCRNVITPVKAHRHHIPTLETTSESTKSFDINAMERVRRLACDGRAAVDPPLLTGAGCLNSPFPCTVHFILLNQRTCIHVYIQIMLHSCALILPLCTQMVHLRHGHRSSAPSSHSSLLLPVPTCHL